MKELWNKFTSWLSGWPQGTKEGKKLSQDEALFREEASRDKPKIKPKKVKGLNPKKKKARKQGNIK